MSIPALGSLAIAVVLAILAFMLVAKIVRGLVRMAIMLVLLAVLVVAAWSFSARWRQAPQGYLPTDLQARVGEIAKTAFHSPEAQAAWRTVQREVDEMVNRARQSGVGATWPTREVLLRKLEERIATLRKTGHPEAADELADSRKKLLATPAER